MRSFGCVVVLALLTGCPPARLDVECTMDSHCNLDGDVGVCTLAESGRKWCAYPDATCPPTGYRYSDFDVEDEFSDQCVNPALRVRLGGKGAGSVFSNPQGLLCTEDECFTRYPAGTTVQLTAETTTDSFLGWIDGCRGQGTCAVTMDRDQRVTALFGNSGEALWAKQFGGLQHGVSSEIAMDPDGNLIVAGTFSGTFSSGLGAELSGDNGSNDIYVMKLAPSTGSVVWAKRFGGVLQDTANAVTVDSSGAIYLAGFYEGIVNFGDGPRQAASPRSAFALKLRPDGGLDWVRNLGNQIGTEANTNLGIGGISTNNNDLVIAGTFSRTVVVDGTTFTSQPVTGSTTPSDDFYVLKLSAQDATSSWVKSFGGRGLDELGDVVIDNTGGIVVLARFFGQVPPFSADNAQYLNGYHVFLLKLTPNGTQSFFRHFAPSSLDETTGFLTAGNRIRVDEANNILIAGIIQTADSNPPPINFDFGCSNKVGYGPFVARFLPSGQCAWLRGLGGGGNSSATDFAMNASGEIAVVGNFDRQMMIGVQTLTPVGTDMFAARFTSDGEPLQSRRIGGALGDSAGGVGLSSDGRMFTSGSFTGVADVGGNTLTAAGASDSFVASHAPF